MKIAVLYGGTNEEREVSLVSGKAVYDSLVKRSYEVDLIDTKYDYFSKLKDGNYDIVFIALHGKDGEDGKIQGLLESLNIPYTGSGVLSSAICMDKSITKQIVIANSIKTPKYQIFEKGSNLIIDFPVVVKPINGGSSVGTFILYSQEDFDKYLDTEHPEKFLVEQYIDGKEITVGLLELTKPIALTPIEIKPKKQFYDYEAKYTKGLTEYVMPPTIPENSVEEVKDMSVKLFRLLKCRGFARADYIYDGKDFYFLEMNTIPGFTPTSDVPIAAQFDGISFDEIVEIILKSAFKTKDY